MLQIGEEESAQTGLSSLSVRFHSIVCPIAFLLACPFSVKEKQKSTQFSLDLWVFISKAPIVTYNFVKQMCCASLLLTCLLLSKYLPGSWRWVVKRDYLFTPTEAARACKNAGKYFRRVLLMFSILFLSYSHSFWKILNFFYGLLLWVYNYIYFFLFQKIKRVWFK